MLPHRTQILYLPDISLVCHALELRPGAVAGAYTRPLSSPT